MKLRCHLRGIRGDTPIKELAERSGVPRATLTLIETGRMLPPDKYVTAIEETYGAPIHEWYPPALLVLLQDDEGVE